MSLFCGHSELYSATWPASGSMRNGSAYRRPTSAPLTSAGASSSSPGPQLLPTPTSSEHTGPGHAAQGGQNLRTTVSLLPTPRASDTGTPGRRASEGFRPPLSQVVLPLLPTPKATDGRIGAPTSPRSAAGNTSSDDPRPAPLTIEDGDAHELTPEQVEYNIASGELIQLGAYGHCKYWPVGELHPREYLERLHAAQDRFENALLGLVQPELDRLAERVSRVTAVLDSANDQPARIARQALAEEDRLNAELTALREQVAAAQAENARLRDGYTLIGWWAAREGTNCHYFVLKDGRTDGPFIGLHALRDAALRMAATPLDGET